MSEPYTDWGPRDLGGGLFLLHGRHGFLAGLHATDGPTEADGVAKREAAALLMEQARAAAAWTAR